MLLKLKRISIVSCTTVMLFSCKDTASSKSDNALDAGRNFIRATLDGDFNSAQKLLLKDPRNVELFESYKTFYDRLPAEKKQAYKAASYNINTDTDVNDSVAVINYSNTYMNQPMNIKLVKQENEWKVDFKFTSGDSTAN